MTQRRLERCSEVRVRGETGRPAGWRQVAARPPQLNRFYTKLDFQIAGKGGQSGIILIGHCAPEGDAAVGKGSGRS